MDALQGLEHVVDCYVFLLAKAIDLGSEQFFVLLVYLEALNGLVLCIHKFLGEFLLEFREEGCEFAGATVLFNLTDKRNIPLECIFVNLKLLLSASALAVLLGVHICFNQIIIIYNFFRNLAMSGCKAGTIL